MGLAILGIAITVMVQQTFNKEVPPATSVEEPSEQNITFTLSSPSFDNGTEIPLRFLCQGDNISPALSISNAPSQTKEYVLLMRGPNKEDKDTSYWVVWGIPKDTKELIEGVVTRGTQGTNQLGKQGYDGPCVEPTSTKQFSFELYAIDEALQLPPETTREGVIAAINGKVIAKTILIGTVQPTITTLPQQ